MTTPPVEINVSRFNIDEMCKKTKGKNPTIALFGARGSGKSILTKDILYRYHQAGVPRVVVFSATEGQNSYFEAIVPGFCIHSPVTVEAITAVFESQKSLKMRQQLGLIDQNIDLRLIMVLDDIAFDRTILNSKVLSEIALNGRHSDIVLILSVQYLMTLAVGARSNIDYAFFMGDNSAKNRQRIHEQFGGTYESFKLFSAVFSACTVDYECFVLPGQGTGSPKPEDNSFYYKAQYDLNFRFGSDDMWEFNKRKYLSPGDKYLAQIKEEEHRDRKMAEDAAASAPLLDQAAASQSTVTQEKVCAKKKRSTTVTSGRSKAERTIIVTRS